LSRLTCLGDGFEGTGAAESTSILKIRAAAEINRAGASIGDRNYRPSISFGVSMQPSRRSYLSHDERASRAKNAATTFVNLFGVVVYDSDIEPVPRTKYPVTYWNTATYTDIQKAMESAHSAIDWRLNQHQPTKDLFENSTLPLVDTFGSNGGVLDLLNSNLTKDTMRPGVVSVGADLLEILVSID
jgi:hypothetical protein